MRTVSLLIYFCYTLLPTSLMIFCQSAENLLAIYDLKSELHILRNVYRFYDGYSSFPPRISLFFYRSKWSVSISAFILGIFFSTFFTSKILECIFSSPFLSQTKKGPQAHSAESLYIPPFLRDSAVLLQKMQKETCGSPELMFLFPSAVITCV